MQPETRLREVIKQVSIVREETHSPERDSMLATADRHLRSVVDHLDERLSGEGGR